MTERPHGYARYKLDGCRCYTCGWANASYCDAREQSVRRGTWQPFVDAEPARQHILELKLAGVGERTIAGLAGVDRKRVRDILHGRPERGTGPLEKVRPATAAAILSVELSLDVLPVNQRINATGTHRRLQALCRNGWPQGRLAARLRMSRGSYSNLQRRAQVTAGTARTVRALYDELWRVDPREHGVALRHFGDAVSHARANLWAPVGAWDDDTIDDPAALPDWTGFCGTSEGYRAHHNRKIRPICQPCRIAAAAERAAAKETVAA